MLVNRLEYEAYTPMAEKELKKICTAMREKWPGLHAIALHHRLGREKHVKKSSNIDFNTSPLYKQ